MEGGTTLETVSTPDSAQIPVGIDKSLQQARHGRLPVFDAASAVRPNLPALNSEFDFGKSAWKSTGSIWSTGTSFLDSKPSDEPLRRASLARPATSTNLEASRGAGQALLLSPTMLNMENIPQSKLRWNKAANSANFASRNPVQPLSPSKQRQNQSSHYSNDSGNGTEASSLLDGSSPDIEDTAVDSTHQHQHRRSLTTNARLLPATSAGVVASQGSSEQQMSNSNSIKFNPSGGNFSTLPRHGYTGDSAAPGFDLVNSNPLNHTGPNFFPTIQDGAILSTGGMSKYDNLAHFDGKIGCHIATDDNADNSQVYSQPNFVETIRDFDALGFDHAPNLPQPVPHRMGLIPQPQYPKRTEAPPNRYMPQNLHQLHSTEASLQTPGGNLESIASRLEQPNYFQYTTPTSSGRIGLSPLAAEYRNTAHSPYYPSSGTPPTGPNSIRSTPASGLSSLTSYTESQVVERKMLPNHDPYSFDPYFAHSQYQLPANPGSHYEPSLQGYGMRMNPLARPYMSRPAFVNQGNYSSPPLIPTREPDHSQIIRSALLEEFRIHHKTRRYELKDIYNHVVEFSGDQHASRFIQQKLEVANSEEKEQIFKEIQPNLLQLMQDVFGNYVIQKMFEHGNQSQKKIIANTMKGRVYALSMSMYGCRVVQKAFEHVLTDQQASMIKELDGPGGRILNVVKDQNGNHVVQKAIERIPGEYIQFIVDAHKGQVAKMSTHQYGCRVVQRMLEYCTPQAKRTILDECLEQVLPLITDSYGNYVVQHIIVNGEPSDRRIVVNIVLQQLLIFSKHKFASNIVEKSIQYADEDQRQDLLRGLTGPDEQGLTPVLGLMRDQYGNYVLQKVHAQLRGADRAALERDMKANYPTLRKTSYGKQVIAIEKLLFGPGGTPPMLAAAGSSASSNPPSTNASSSACSMGTPIIEPKERTLSLSPPRHC